MRYTVITVLKAVAIVALTGVYIAALAAVLHPHVSPQYKAYFIDRTSTDYEPSHYNATPEEGILFSRAGVPQWVSGTYGLSAREEQGRWTDGDMGNSAGLTFNNEFNGDVCVDTSFRAVPWLVGDTITLRMGDQEQLFQVRSAELTDYRLQLSAVHHGATLDLILPAKLPKVSDRVHNSGDRRRLGIDIVNLKLIPGECSTPSN